MEALSYTRHANARMCQRNLKASDIEFIVRHARAQFRTGIRFFRLRDKDLPPDLPGNSPFRRLVGTTVLVCHCNCVITAYRNDRAHKKDRRKPDYDTRRDCACHHSSKEDAA